MKFYKSNERGNTNPGITLAILIIMGIIAYLAFDSINPDDPSTMSLSSLYTTWLGWPWWSKGLSIVSPIALLLAGSILDNASGFGKLPSDDK